MTGRKTKHTGHNFFEATRYVALRAEGFVCGMDQIIVLRTDLRAADRGKEICTTPIADLLTY